jgi:hypothetical protein
MKKGQTVHVTVDKAERDAIAQVLDRHGGYLDNYERDLLQKLLNRINGAAAAGSSGAAAPPVGGPPQGSS